MNVNEVPQEGMDYKGGDKRKLMYAVGKDGQYTGVNSSGWEPQNLALRQAWEDIEESLKETEARVKAGELSPIPYFMQRSLMDLPLLAKYMGKWRWTVKKHFKPSNFEKLDDKTIGQYAAVFNISAGELKNFGR